MSVETASDYSGFLDSHLSTSTYISLLRTVSRGCPKPQRKLGVASFVFQGISAETVRSKNGLNTCERSRKPSWAGGVSMPWSKLECLPAQRQHKLPTRGVLCWVEMAKLCILNLLEIGWGLRSTLRRAGGEQDLSLKVARRVTGNFDMGSKSFPETRGFEWYIPMCDNLGNGGF